MAEAHVAAKQGGMHWARHWMLAFVPIALAIATVLFWYGRTTKRMR